MVDSKVLAKYLDSSPYSIDDPRALKEAAEAIAELEERMAELRQQGTLSDKTLKRYFGDKRYEQVAESNAIEGSTLDVGETRLAIEKGTTLPKDKEIYVRDAQALNEALSVLESLAADRDSATDIDQARQIHEQLMGERPGAGLLRKQPVAIVGAEHTPPKDYEGVLSGMEDWARWSKNNSGAPAVLRATVLHAWLTHVHPYVDGNGRTARAISSLELVRAGYPVAIIPRKRRQEYLETLAESDSGGEIRQFLELMLELADNALTGLEQAVKETQELANISGAIAIRKQQDEALHNRPQLLKQGVYLLLEAIEHNLNKHFEALALRATIKIFKYDWPLDADKYLSLCEGNKATYTWCFNLSIGLPLIDRKEEVRLAYFGRRSSSLRQQLNNEGGVSIFWSNRNWDGFRKWKTDDDNAPHCVEMSLDNEKGDLWYVRPRSSVKGQHEQLTTSELAKKIAEDLAQMAMREQN